MYILRRNFWQYLNNRLQIDTNISERRVVIPQYV